MNAQHMPGPWNTLSDDERARIYQDASLRIHDIEWYRFHGIDPRDNYAAETARGLLRYHARHGRAAIAKATGAGS